MSWSKKILGDICDFQGGSQPPKKEFKYENLDGYDRFLQIRDFGSDKNVTYISASKKNRYCNEDDILIGRYGASVGKILRGLSGAYNVALMKIIPHEEEVVKPWLYYFLLSSLFQKPLLKVANRSAQNGFNKDDIKQFRVDLPSLPEQKKIVFKLDIAFAEIEKSLNLKKLQMIENKMLFKSTLNNCFSESYEFMRIEELGQVSSGGTPSTTNPNYWEGNIQWYSSGELNDKFTAKSIKKISHEGLENSNAKVFPKDSLLVGMYDTAAMKMSILSEESTFNQAIVGIAPNKFASTEYLFYALNYLKESILLQRRGVRQQNLSLSKIKKIEVPIPNFEKQKSIVEKLNFISQQSQFYEEYLSKIIDNLLALKAAILSKEFQGEIL